jgi:ATP-dependent RNA helicase DOB1
VYTGYRPTPLQHFIFPQGGEGMYQVVGENSVFRSDQFQKAIAAIKPVVRGKAKGGDAPDAPGGKGKGGRPGQAGEASDAFKLVQMVVAKGYDPLIVFAFGKAKCEALAQQARRDHR